MQVTKAKKGLIITYDQTDVLDDIQVIPIWKWEFRL
jgi:predicted AAA+ superfamily ATPase